MAENIRLIHKHGTKEELNGYCPKVGELVTITGDPNDAYSYPRTILGDGVKTVSSDPDSELLPSVCTCLYGTSVPATIPAGVVYFVYRD